LRSLLTFAFSALKGYFDAEGRRGTQSYAEIIAISTTCYYIFDEYDMSPAAKPASWSSLPNPQRKTVDRTILRPAPLLNPVPCR